MTRRHLFGLMLPATFAFAQSQKNAHPLVDTPVVTFSGKIVRVQTNRMSEMPLLEVDSDGRVRVVRLGSMRYLMEKGFNPKAGQQVTVRGFELKDVVLAQQIEIPAEKVVLKLREPDGTPVWRGRGGAGRK